MTSINGMKDFGLSILWQASENYLDIGKKANQIHSVSDRIITITPSSHKAKWIHTVLKIISYITVILPLIALIIKAVYRKKYAIEIYKPTPSTKPYSLNSVINKIINARIEGLKVGVFVGKQDEEPIPKEKGWLWVSLDCAMQKALDLDRPHLKIDVNTPAIDLLYQLCNKVVVDISVIKFFDTIWEPLHSMLSPEADSELMVEALSGINSFTQENEPIYDIENATYKIPSMAKRIYYREAQNAFEDWKVSVGQPEATKQYELFLKTLPADKVKQLKDLYSGTDEGLRSSFMSDVLKKYNIEPKKISYEDELFARTKVHLETLFNSVVLKKGRYPYESHWNSDDFKYWICRSPKLVDRG